MMVQNFQRQRDSSLLLKLICLSAIIIIANFLIGIIAPIFYDVDDEIGYLDTLWRVVRGQRVGVDYHNPMGFNEVTVRTKGGKLTVEYDRVNDEAYTNVWLCGPAEKVYEGNIELKP